MTRQHTRGLRQSPPVTLLRLPSTARPLSCHPATPCPVALRVTAAWAAVGSEDGPGLLLHFALEGDTAGLRLPPPIEPGPADGLWQHTCFEAFVGASGDPAYREFNFAPSGQWAAYRFADTRERDRANETPVRPHIEPLTRADGLSMRVWLPLRALPPVRHDQSWELGLSAVIETTDGQLSYWALHHPGQRPDFHHRGGWLPQPELPALFPPDLPHP